MKTIKPYFVIGLFIWFCFITCGISSCKKEYSFEGNAVNSDTTRLQDTSIVRDTSISAIQFATCKGCNTIDTASGSHWSFQVGEVKLCGGVTRAVISPDSLGMTFFGPSLCSIDSGLIITVFFLENTFNKNQINIIASRASLQYYDNITPSDVMVSKRPNVFNLTILNFTPAVGFSGVFNGWVIDRLGKLVKVDNGKFIIRF